MNEQLTQILVDAQKLISRESNWSKKDTTIYGKWVPTTKFSAVGAIQYIIRRNDLAHDLFTVARHVLDSGGVEWDRFNSLTEANEDPEVTHGDIMNLFDAAISRSKSETPAVITVPLTEINALAEEVETLNRSVKQLHAKWQREKAELTEAMTIAISMADTFRRKREENRESSTRVLVHYLNEIKELGEQLAVAVVENATLKEKYVREKDETTGKFKPRGKT